MGRGHRPPLRRAVSGERDHRRHQHRPRRRHRVAKLAASRGAGLAASCRAGRGDDEPQPSRHRRSEEHTSELQSLMRISYAVFCLKKKKSNNITPIITPSPITSIEANNYAMTLDEAT